MLYAALRPQPTKQKGLGHVAGVVVEKGLRVQKWR